MDIDVVIITGGIWVSGGVLVAIGWYWFKRKR